MNRVTSSKKKNNPVLMKRRGSSSFTITSINFYFFYFFARKVNVPSSRWMQKKTCPIEFSDTIEPACYSKNHVISPSFSFLRIVDNLQFNCLSHKKYEQWWCWMQIESDNQLRENVFNVYDWYCYKAILRHDVFYIYDLS